MGNFSLEGGMFFRSRGLHKIKKGRRFDLSISAINHKLTQSESMRWCSSSARTIRRMPRKFK